MKKNNGFTLIEILITTAIAGILMSIALPSYTEYVLRAELTEGITALSGMRIKMEQYFQDNRTYVGACTNGSSAPLPSGLKYFTLSCSNLSDTGYDITATGSGFTFTLDEINNRATTNAPTNWNTNNSCWIINKKGDCQ